jgi:hypothetical protein
MGGLFSGIALAITFRTSTHLTVADYSIGGALFAAGLTLMLAEMYRESQKPHRRFPAFVREFLKNGTA